MNFFVANKNASLLQFVNRKIHIRFCYGQKWDKSCLSKTAKSLTGEK